MAIEVDYTFGTVDLTNGSATVVGNDVLWLTRDVRPGDTLMLEGLGVVILTVDAEDEFTLAEPWPGSTGTGLAYRIRFQPDGSRYTATAIALMEQLSLAGRLTIDAQVATLPDRDIYNGQGAGFVVVVSDMGDGRSAAFTKASSDPGDWVGPAYISGEQGIQGIPGSSDVTGTSTSSVEIGTGSKAFTIVEADRGWAAGARLRITSASSPATRYMEGIVTAYSGTSLTVLVDLLGTGTGTHADWTINLVGEAGGKGWSPRLIVVADGPTREVLQLDDWIGGAGAKPGNVGDYIGPAGFTSDIGDAVNVKGETGATGATGAVGMTWQGAWDIATAYVANDLVSDPDGADAPAIWIALTSTTGDKPRDSATEWAFFPGTFSVPRDYGSITDAATESRDYGDLS